MDKLPSNKENMTKLVEALESGEYQQGQGKLRNKDDLFCCLGVACDVASKEGIGHWGPEAIGSYRFIGNDGGSNSSFLPMAVAGWLGVDNEALSMSLDGEDTAVWLNDTGKSFAEIATAIREAYL